MDVKLGIDTGGSFTDAVVIDPGTQEIIRSAKARTTKDNLVVGIEQAIDRLRLAAGETVTLVCLSTTLATNAIVEGKGSRVALVTIGSCCDGDFPAKQTVNIGGKISVTGCELEPLSDQEITRALNAVDTDIEALAISGYASVRNPVHEIRVAKLARQMLDIPAVCAHELTQNLGYRDRTVTAVLNARLIPIIKELIAATKAVLRRRDIKAPVLIVKGTGHVVIDSFAEERPVETILSGPAASIVAGLSLAKRRNAIVADMGGTTTDIVAVHEGCVPLDKRGATVGNWKTMVKAARINTYGLGGDSFIDISATDGLVFGPRRVEPLCVAVAESPSLLEELEAAWSGVRVPLLNRHLSDCFRLCGRGMPKDIGYTLAERKIVRLLEDGPHAVSYLGAQLDRDIDKVEVDRLLAEGVVQRIALTPTDLLHAAGEYTEYDREAAILGARMYADRLGMGINAFLARAMEQFVFELAAAVLQTLCSIEGFDSGLLDEPGGKALLEVLLGRRRNDYVDLRAKMKVPIIGIGAPAAAWLPRVARLLDADLIIPDHSPVANAFGAVACNTQEVMESLVRFNRNADKFVAHTPKSRELFDTIKEAKDFSKFEMIMAGRELAARLKIEEYEISISEQDRYSAHKKGVADGFIESKVRMVLSGTVLKEKKTGKAANKGS